MKDKLVGRNLMKLTAMIAFIFLLSVLMYYYLLPIMASFLIFKTNIRHVDTIIVLGGDSERLPYGIKLYKSNYSNKIIISGGDISKKQILESGVPLNDIILENKSTTTYENAKFSREIMLRNNFKSAIVVSSPYHMRRTSLIFGNIFKKDNIILLYSPVNNSWFKSDNWTNKLEMKVILEEYAKIVYYIVFV